MTTQSWRWRVFDRDTYHLLLETARNIQHGELDQVYGSTNVLLYKRKAWGSLETDAYQGQWYTLNFGFVLERNVPPEIRALNLLLGT